MAESTVIEIDRWIPTEEGMLKFDGMRTYAEVWNDLSAALSAEGLTDEYFSLYNPWDHINMPLPRIRRIACFAVTGGSEGHYIHIEFFHRDSDKTELFALGKTFDGWDRAWEIAKRCAELLGL